MMIPVHLLLSSSGPARFLSLAFKYKKCIASKLQAHSRRVYFAQTILILQFSFSLIFLFTLGSFFRWWRCVWVSTCTQSTQYTVPFRRPACHFFSRSTFISIYTPKWWVFYVYICNTFVCTMYIRTIQYYSTHFTAAQLCCSPVTFVYQPNDQLCTFSIFLIEILPSFLGGFCLFSTASSPSFSSASSFVGCFFWSRWCLTEIDVVFACSRCRLRYVHV